MKNRKKDPSKYALPLYRAAALLLAAAYLLPLTGCVSKGLSPQHRSSGSTHAGRQTPAQDFAASAGNVMSNQMDNSIKGSLSQSGASGESEVTESQASDESRSTVESGSAAGSNPAKQQENLPAAAQAQTPLPENRSAAASESTAVSDPAAESQTTAESEPAGSAPALADPQTEGFLTLVNDARRLPEDYAPPLGGITGSEKQLHVTAAQALDQMLAAAAADGCPLHVVSGYRSVKYQQGLFERKVQSCLDAGLSPAEADAEAAKWVARPGASEHSLGLAVDLVSGDWYLQHDDLTQDFETTAAFAWLAKNAAQYGFILRYPADKEAVTGVHYEPWHYRYVGEAAPEIARSGLCLEEWLA